MDPMQSPANMPQTPEDPQPPQEPLAPQQQTPPVEPMAQPTMSEDQSAGVTPQSAFGDTTVTSQVNAPMPTQPIQPSVPQQPPVQPVMPVAAPTEPVNNPFQQMSSMDQPVTPTPQFAQPEFTPPVAAAPGWKKFLLPAIIVVAVILVLVGGYFAYGFISSKFQKAVTTSSTNQVADSTKTNVPEINTLKNFTMLAPDASKTQGMTATQVQSATEMVSSDGRCTLIYGTETQAQLPGTDIGDVISQYLAKLKQQSPHLIVNGPNKAASLVLAGTDGKSYSLPTVNFTYTDSVQVGAANGIYSVSQLSDGSHAVVASICGNDTTKNASDLQPQVSALEAAASTIKVQVQ